MTDLTTQAREMIERLERETTDWCGEPMPDGEGTRGEFHCKDLREAATLIRNLLAEREARENITDELQASQYRAGAQAGWNAAQLIWPKSQEAIARLTNVNKGDLNHIQAANSARKAKEA